MLLSPDPYSQTSVAELLREAARGTIGLDQRWLRAALEREEACAPDLLAFLREQHNPYAFDLREDVLRIARHFASAAMLPVPVELARGYPAEEWPEELSAAFRAIAPRGPCADGNFARRSRRALRKIELVAGGLPPREAEIVMEVLDDRLLRAGRFPAFMNCDEQDEEATEPELPYVAPPNIGRNDPCPCAGGNKHKKGCGT